MNGERPQAGKLGRWATRVFWVALIGLAVALMVAGIHVLLAIFGGLLLGVLLHALSAFVAGRTGLSYPWALGGVVTLLLIMLGLGGWFLGGQIAQQADEISQSVPQMIREIKGKILQQGWGRWVLQQAENAPNELPMEAGSGVLEAVSNWGTYLLTVFFVGLFAAARPMYYRRGLVGFFPRRHRPLVDEVLGEIGYTLRWWLIGQAIAMGIIGLSTGLMLWAFGVPLALVLGVTVGLLGFIPYLGPIIGLVPVALVAATQGTTTLVYVLLAYTVIQMLEGYIATPLIQKRMVYLPPLVTIAFQVLFGTVLGILGFTLATPLAAVLLVLSRFYRREVLGDAQAER
jgi:predicted PurR-regulated permease PerM